MISPRRTLTTLVIALLATVGVYVLSETISGGSNTSVAPGSVIVGQQAPRFVASAADGKSLSLKDFQGRRVWLAFGATWCTDCRVEAPLLDTAANRHRDLAVVSVWVKEPGPTVRAYLRRVGTTHESVLDPDGKIAAAYRVNAFPTHVLIGDDGRVKAVRVGAVGAEGVDELLRG